MDLETLRYIETLLSSAQGRREEPGYSLNAVRSYIAELEGRCVPDCTVMKAKLVFLEKQNDDLLTQVGALLEKVKKLEQLPKLDAEAAADAAVLQADVAPAEEPAKSP
jgi:hypothetical protein